MSTQALQRLSRLRSEAYALKHGPTRVAILEEAVALADSEASKWLQFSTRLALIEAATFAGQPEKALVAFVWCLALSDRDPDTNDPQMLMWQYKWIVSALPHFANVSAERIESTLDDLARRFELHGLGLRAVHQLRMACALQMGRAAESKAAFRQWRAVPRDTGSDCDACVQDRLVQYFAFHGDYRQALAAARPILKGKLSCEEIPHLTLGRVLVPMMESGQWEDAAAAHRRGYRLARGEHLLPTLGEHIEYLTIVGNMRSAVSAVERHLATALDAFGEWERLSFLRPVCLLFTAMARTARRPRKLRMPPEFPLREQSGEYDVASIAAWARAEVDKLASALDRRNRNTYYAESITHALKRFDRLAAAGPE